MITTDKTITIRKQDECPIPGTLIKSTAPIILHIIGDDVHLPRLDLIGEGNRSKKQIGIFSETASHCSIKRGLIQQVTTCVKLDRQAAKWEVCSLELLPYGKEAGFGYGVLIGSTEHTITNLKGYGNSNDLRHVLYLTDGASFCNVDTVEGNASNNATVAVFSGSDRRAAHNTLRNIIARNQMPGGTDSAGLEIDGNVLGTVIRDYRCRGIGRNGITVKSMGLIGQSDTLIDGFVIEDCGEHGILLDGVNGCIIKNGIVREVSKSSNTSFSCIHIVSWYREEVTINGVKRKVPQVRSENILIDQTVSLHQGIARETVNINNTPPVPSNIFNRSTEI